jgi:hypothetical protein
MSVTVTTAVVAVTLLGWRVASTIAQQKPAESTITPAQLAERTAHRRAVESVIWGMPAVNYDLMLQEMLAKTPGRVGQVIYWGRPLDAKNQTLTPNPDALYFMVFFNTKDGPVVLDLPPGDAGGSFNGNIVTVWQMPLEDAGLLGVDKGKGGKFLVLPPWYKEKPPDGYIPLQSDTFGGYLLFRANFKSHSDADVQKSIAYGKRMKVYPLSKAASPPATVFTDVKDVDFDSTIRYDASFFKNLDRIVQNEPWIARDRAMIQKLQSLGIEKGKQFNPDAKTSAAFFAIGGLPAQPAGARVTVETFVRAESHRYFTNRVKQGGFGKLFHQREPIRIDRQPVVRGNRDTLYSSGIFDFDAGTVTVTLPDAGKRYMSLLVIDEDEYCSSLAYEPRAYTFTKEKVGTRYAMIAIRTLFDPTKPGDSGQAHKLQDTIEVAQPGGPGKFEVPDWDRSSLDKLRGALLTLAATVPDSRRMFGARDQVDPVRHIIGAAAAWGGNREKDALYLNRYPVANDGKTVHRLVVKDVPVDAFWSVSVYNAEGYFEKNEHDAYTLNNLTARKGDDGSVAIQFGGYDGRTPNCLPITPGWNFMVRLYRPRAEVLDGTWTFPEAKPVR